MNVLLHQAALGDFVLTFPILSVMQGDTLVVTHASKAKLAAKLFPHVRPMDVESTRWREHVAAANGLVISFVGEIGRPCCVVNPQPPVEWTRHVSMWHRHELSRQRVVLADPVLRAPWHGDGPVVIHAGSGGRDKCWPLDRVRVVAQRLRRDADVRVIVGEAEAERWTAAELSDIEVLSTLDDLHDTLADASLYVGHDSGPTHLAAWMGLPTVALFGPSAPRVWHPIGPNVTLLAPPAPAPMTWLTVEAVIDATRRFP